MSKTETMPTTFDYTPWRHGGWYVSNVRWPSGGVGCVSRNYPDGKWRIVCDPRPEAEQPTFKTRDAAARAEWEFTRMLRADAQPYIDTAKPGDEASVGECSNPSGWWTVYRNGRPVHHFPERWRAEKMADAIRHAPGTRKAA